MPEKKSRHDEVLRDFTVSIEGDKFFFEVTYECKFIIHRYTVNDGCWKMDIDWDRSTPISSWLTDANDTEWLWQYGDNKPVQIERFMEKYEDQLQSLLNRKVINYAEQRT